MRRTNIGERQLENLALAIHKSKSVLGHALAYHSLENTHTTRTDRLINATDTSNGTVTEYHF